MPAETKADGLDLDQVKDGELHKWDKVGVTVVGVLKSYQSRQTKMGEGQMYEVKTKNGTVAFFAPSLLHKKLSEVPVGNIVSIKYTEKSRTNSGTDLKHFEVSHGKPTPERLKAIGLDIVDKAISADDIDI